MTLPDGRTLAFDDVGDPNGVTVVYLHGTPDSRLARHPDDGLARAAGVRLIAVDRPGSGASSRHVAAPLEAFGADLAALVDELGIDKVSLLGWSSGGLVALASARYLAGRLAGVVTVAGLPPVEAYVDSTVRGALGPNRLPFVELAADVPAAELASEMAPYMVPAPLTAQLARDHVVEGAGDAGRRDLEKVPGAVERLADALMEAMAQGPDWLADDLAAQLQPGLDLARVSVPVVAVHGTEDDIAPPAVGDWLVTNLPHASTRVIPGGSHHLLFPCWTEVLDLVKQTA